MHAGVRLAVAGAAILVAVLDAPSAMAATASGHSFRTWTQERAKASSPLLHAVRATGDRKAAGAFSERVSAHLHGVEAELRERFSSAAIDPASGTVLVIRITGSAETIDSPTLERLDDGPGEVRIVEHQSPASNLDAEYRRAAQIVGETIGEARVVLAAEDHMTGRVVIGVDRDANEIAATLRARFPRSAVVLTPAAGPTDGGIWGNSSARVRVPAAGGNSIRVGNTGCTAGFPVTSGGAPSLVTAGHCFDGWAGWSAHTAWLPGLVQAIGLASVTYTPGASGKDIAVVNNSTGSPGAENCIVVTNGTASQPANTCRPVSYTSTPAIAQGTTATATGARTGDADTTILAVNATHWHPSGTINDAILTDHCALQSDSGGPLYIGVGVGAVTPIGVVVRSSTGEATQCPTGPALSVSQSWRETCAQIGVDDAYCPPSRPTGLRITRALPSSLTLSWQPAARASSYRVLRNGSVVATSATTSATFSIPTGEFVYTIESVNSANVPSPPSIGLIAARLGNASPKGVAIAGSRAIYYVGSDYRIWAWRHDGSSWQNTLIAGTGGQLAGPNTSPIVWASGDVYYVGADGQIWSWTRAAGGLWNNAVVGGGGHAAAVNTSPAMSSDGKIVYVGANGKIWNWWRDSGGTWHNSMIAGTGGQSVAPGTSPTVSPNSRTVFYVGSDSRIWTWWHGSGIWHNSRISGTGGEPVAPGTSPSAAPNHPNQVLYVGTNNRIWSWHHSGGWLNSMITPTGGQTLASNTSPSASATIGDVFHVGSNDKIWSWWHDGSAWQNTMIAGTGGQTAASNTSPTASPVAAQVVYVGSDDLVWSWYRNSAGIWQNNVISGTGGQAVATYVP